MEFVLWLPVLLSVTALMVVFGVMGAWRVRGEIVSRDAVWRTRWPRTGANEPRPDQRTWPADAEMRTVAADPFTSLDVPEIDHPVVRGPLGRGFRVKETLEPTRGAREGRSAIVQPYPLLPDLGPYRSGQIRHPLLDGHWRIAEMRAPNLVRRTLILYELPKTEQSLPKAFVDVVKRVTGMSNYHALDVLDRDEEIRKYRGGYVDFHPRAQRKCTLDAKQVYEQEVKRLIDTRNDKGEIQLGAISHLPRNMTNYFLNMYRSRVQALKNQIQQMQQEQRDIPSQLSDLAGQESALESEIAAGGGGPSSDLQSQLAGVQSEQAALRSRLSEIPGLISSAESEIATLQPKISQLEAFQERLGDIEQRLKDKADAVIP